MKSVFFSILVSLGLTTTAFASEKVCTGFDNNIDSRGIVLGVTLSSNKIVIKALEGDSYAGTYNLEGKSTLNGKPSVTFEGEDDGYFNFISVEQSLLDANTEGSMKIRSVGEGYLDTYYNCHDAGLTGF